MTILSLILVVGGFLGSTLGGPNGLIVLAFLGLFGPFLLRELGILRWRDDFQREAVMRSGMHALVAVGVLLTAVVSVQGAGGSYSAEEKIRYADAFPLGVVFALLAVTWGLSWLLQFWGVRTGAFRILLWTMATVTAVGLSTNVYLALSGRPMSWHGIWTGGVQVLIGWALVLLSRRWPRITALLLIGIVGWMVWTTGAMLAHQGHPSVVLVISLVGLPFLVPAIALLASRDDDLDARHA